MNKTKQCNIVKVNSAAACKVMRLQLIYILLTEVLWGTKCKVKKKFQSVSQIFHYFIVYLAYCAYILLTFTKWKKNKC